MKITAIDHKKGKTVIVGSYDPKTSIFHRHFRACHILRIAKNAVGLQDSVIQELDALGCTTVHFHNQMGWTYVTSFEQWKQRPAMDYGHGKQHFISLSDMDLWESADG